MKETGAVDYGFLDSCLDFFRIYVDANHHGKEEEILFKDLATKPLSSEDRAMLSGLIDDHVRLRKATEQLRVARNQPGPSGTAEMTKHMDTLITGYPVHIEKEDKHFFPAAMTYLSEEEQATMLQRMNDFDRTFTQQRYIRIVRELEERKK
jgi:hemerythrin-like domain-containing protein